MYSTSSVHIENVPDAGLIEPTDAVVRVTRAAICGSDLWPYSGLEHISETGRRGHGIGGMLLDATLAALRALGAPRVVLLTAEGNGSARRLFARAGFRRTMIEMAHELNDYPLSAGRA